MEYFLKLGITSESFIHGAALAGQLIETHVGVVTQRIGQTRRKRIDKGVIPIENRRIAFWLAVH